MRRKVFVAESSQRKISLVQLLNSLVGDEGADLAIGWRVLTISGVERGNSSDTVLFGRSENLGIGKELGGGEFEYVGPAQRSENESLLIPISSAKALSFLRAFALILIGALLGVVLEYLLLSEGAGDSVPQRGEEMHRSVTGAAQAFNGVGSMPAPNWKLRQLIPPKSLDGEEPKRAGPLVLSLP